MQRNINNLLIGLFACMAAGLVIVIVLFMTGCRSMKTTTSQTAVTVAAKKDSASKELHTAVVRADSVVSEKETKDTAIGLPGEVIHYDGVADTVVKKGNLTLRTWTDKKGKKHTECKADSLTLVVERLIKERTVILRNNDSLAYVLDYMKDSSGYSHEVVANKEMVKESGSFWFWLKISAVYIIIVCLLWALIEIKSRFFN